MTESAEVVRSASIRRARALARVLDSAVGVPGTPIRLGLDAVLGLVPGAGDLAGAALSGYIVLVAARNGAPRSVIGRMLFNIFVDTTLGSVPVIGDLFDVAYKSNLKNVALLERFAAQPTRLAEETRRRGAVLAFLLLVAMLAIGVGVVLLARVVWHALTH